MVIAVTLAVLLLLTSGVVFYLSKLNLLEFSDGKFKWNGTIDETESDVLEEASRMDEAIADREEKGCSRCHRRYL